MSFSSFLAAPTQESIHGPLHLQDLDCSADIYALLCIAIPA